MDWKDFVASIVGSLAWPLGLVIVVLVLRHHVAGILDELKNQRTKKLSVGTAGLSWEFYDEQLAEAREVLKRDGDELSDPSDVPSVARASETDPKTLQSALQESPRAAVVDSFARTEAAFRELARTAGMEGFDSAPTQEVLDWLHVHAVIGAGNYNAGIRLLQTRNEALHSKEEIDQNRALRFLSTSAEIRKRLASIKLEL